MTELLKDAKDKLSSKRVAGYIGLFVMVVVSGWAVFKDPAVVSQIMWPWAVFVGAVLGVTVLEKRK